MVLYTSESDTIPKYSQRILFNDYSCCGGGRYAFCFVFAAHPFKRMNYRKYVRVVPARRLPNVCVAVRMWKQKPAARNKKPKNAFTLAHNFSLETRIQTCWRRNDAVNLYGFCSVGIFFLARLPA